MLPKLRRLFRRPPHLRTCPNCQQLTPIRAADCPHCGQSLARLRPVQMHRSNTTIRPRSFREKLFTRRHPVNGLLGLFIVSLLLFLLSSLLTITSLVIEVNWDNLSAAVFPLIFGLIALLAFIALRRARHPRGKQIYPDEMEQEWLDKLAEKDRAE